MLRSETDLEQCAREAIHIPAAIQPHGALLTLSPKNFVVRQASRNATAYFGFAAVPGACLSDHLPSLVPQMAAWMASGEPTFQTRLDGGDMLLTAHRSGDNLVLEAERSSSEGLETLFSRLRGFAPILAVQSDLSDSLYATSTFIADLTGFDRVLIYRFDPDWNGHVVAEAGNRALPSYLDLRFPAEDIPAQARALYASNRLRLIPDVSYEPVPIEPPLDPASGAPLDLSLAQFRSVSPVHLEYMRNMGTEASMSISIMVDGRLWGLVSCHSARPHIVGGSVRDACDFVVQSLAMRIAAQQNAEDAASRVRLAKISARLLTVMAAASTWLEGLFGNPDLLIDQVGANGAAILVDDDCRLFGATPAEEHVRAIAAWLDERGEVDIYATSSLARDFPEAEGFRDDASGVVAMRLSELHSHWLIWFRPEVIRTVQWGGNPHKQVHESGRIHPRKSFEAWREQVRLHSLAWTPAELSAARDLRNAIVGIVLRKAEELAELTRELQRSNKELEAFSYSVSHDLRAPFRHIVGFAQLLRDRETALDPKSMHYLQTISDSALAAGRLVDDLLNFSQLGRTSISHKHVDMNKLVAEVLRSVTLSLSDRQIEWSIATLPDAWGDATLLRQVWFNLVENAVKYTRPRRPATIRIDGNQNGDMVIYRVADNGVGFDMTYVNKLFGVFQRLQRTEDFEGTGIGLALVRRIVERHNGSVAAEGAVNEGATFSFALPGPERKGRAIA